MSTTIEREFSLTHDEVEYEVVAEAEWSKDLYGCDADGNRGQLVYYCETTTFKIYNEQGEDVTSLMENKLDGEIQKYMEDHPPEGEDDYDC